MMTTFDENGKNGNIGWVYTRNPRGLGQSFRLVAFQLLTAFKSHSGALFVIQPFRDPDGLVHFCAFSSFPLLFNIRFIMSHNIYFLNHRGE